MKIFWLFTACIFHEIEMKTWNFMKINIQEINVTESKKICVGFL